jgi:PBP1b-binding outer membrane lipoprotein LpoB
MRKMTKQILTLVLLTVLLTACKSYYNDTIDWMDNIELGTSLEDVKKQQPDFVKINWDKPDSVDNQVRYWVTEIKGNKDILAMSHLLVFVDNKYSGRESHK